MNLLAYKIVNDTITSIAIDVKPSIKYIKTFLWKPTKVSDKWRWLIHAYKKFEYYKIPQEHINHLYMNPLAPFGSFRFLGYCNDQDMFLESL